MWVLPTVGDIFWLMFDAWDSNSMADIDIRNQETWLYGPTFSWIDGLRWKHREDAPATASSQDSSPNLMGANTTGSSGNYMWESGLRRVLISSYQHINHWASIMWYRRSSRSILSTRYGDIQWMVAKSLLSWKRRFIPCFIGVQHVSIYPLLI